MRPSIRHSIAHYVIVALLNIGSYTITIIVQFIINRIVTLHGGTATAITDKSDQDFRDSEKAKDHKLLQDNQPEESITK